jgi:hypothetical protein
MASRFLLWAHDHVLVAAGMCFSAAGAMLGGLSSEWGWLATTALLLSLLWRKAKSCCCVLNIQWYPCLVDDHAALVGFFGLSPSMTRVLECCPHLWPAGDGCVL